MSLRNLFRLLVVLSPALQLFGTAYQLLAEPHLSEDWRAVFAWSGEGGWLPSDFAEHLSFAAVIGSVIALIVFVLAMLVVQVGMFRFRTWARTANLILTVLCVIAVPFCGLSIALPLEAACHQLASIADGFVLALAYFSPLRREFAMNRNA